MWVRAPTVSLENFFTTDLSFEDAKRNIWAFYLFEKKKHLRFLFKVDLHNTLYNKYKWKVSFNM